MVVSPSSKFYFPLRTNTGFFDSQDGALSLMNLAKQASLLYDEVIFEDGLYVAAVWPDRYLELWGPGSQITPEMLLDGDRFQPTGSRVGLLVQGSTGSPVINWSGEVDRSFRCEFLSITNAIDIEENSWVRRLPLVLSRHGEELRQQLVEAVVRSDPQDSASSADPLQSIVLGNLCHDLVTLSSTGWHGSLNSQYHPLISRTFESSVAQGFDALSVVVPNVSALSWSEIRDIRELPSVLAFRSKLVEVEQKVLKSQISGNRTRAESQIAILQELLDQVTSEMRQWLPSKTGFAKDIAVDMVCGALPIPALGIGITALQGMDNLIRSESSWAAAFMKLRDQRKK